MPTFYVQAGIITVLYVFGIVAYVPVLYMLVRYRKVDFGSDFYFYAVNVGIGDILVLLSLIHI